MNVFPLISESSSIFPDINKVLPSPLKWIFSLIILINNNKKKKIKFISLPLVPLLLRNLFSLSILIRFLE